MRKNYMLSFILTLVAVAMQAQITFDNNGGTGDNNWSTATNWVGDALPTDTDAVIIAADVTLDMDDVVANIEMGGSGDYTITGTNTLTLALDATSPQIIKNIKNAVLTLDCNITFTATGTTNIDTVAGKATNKIIFASGKTLTIAGLVNLKNYSDNAIEFNGNLAGAGTLQIHKNSNSDVIFGSTADLSAHTGQLLNTDNTGTIAKFVSNITTAGGLRAAAGVLKVTVSGITTEINGADTFSGTFNFSSASGSSTLDINAQQTSIASLKTAGSSANTTVLDLADVSGDGSVVIGSFALASTSFLNITSFANKKVKFTATLTESQLNQIQHDGTANELAQDPDGFIVLASTLSISESKIEGASVTAKDGLITVLGAKIDAVYSITGAKVGAEGLTSGIYIVKISKGNLEDVVKVIME